MGLYFEVPKPTHTFRNPTPSWSESEGLEEPRKRAVAEPNVAEKKAAMAGGNRSSFCFRNLILLCSLCLEHGCYVKIIYTINEMRESPPSGTPATFLGTMVILKLPNKPTKATLFLLFVCSFFIFCFSLFYIFSHYYNNR